jgi:hypothetical protein
MSTTATESTKTDRIVKAAESVDITSTNAWHDLDLLATRVLVDRLSVDPETVTVDGDRNSFQGHINLYVTLEYDPNSPDSFSSNESFSGTFEGHFSNGQPIVDTVNVDTSRFYS